MDSARSETDDRTFDFGPFKLAPERQLLLREGVPVKIGGRAFDILTLLVRRAGEVVSKNELLAFCWPNTYVQESNLKVNVAALRRILGDENAGRYIATVPNRGYRFVAKIEEHLFEPAANTSTITHDIPIRRPANIVGRGAEIRKLEQELHKARCLTIVGPGGIGKTTVALALAHDVQGQYPQGVFFIDLSTVGDPQYTIAAVTSAVGAHQRSSDALSEIIAVLSGRKVLLVLDNCEHVQATISSMVASLLARLPMLTILATSREPLFNPYESLHRLPGLSVPADDENLTAREALNFSAVDLFVARAGSRANFILSDDDAPLVAAICSYLDGIPLAIELVASKTFAYGIDTLLTMLKEKFLLLGNGERTAPLRQQTMLATLDWSYRLLLDDEAALLRALSIFSGSFTLGDAVAVAAVLGFEESHVTDTLERLVSKSLINLDDRDGFLAYRLLESTRAFARERLSEAGERDAALLGLARRTLAIFEQAASESETRDKSDWMAEYSPRIDDARSVLAWAIDSEGDMLLGIRLTAAVAPLLYELSAINELQNRVGLALKAADRLSDLSKELRVKLVAARASGQFFAQHVTVDIEATWRECYELGRDTGIAKYEIIGLWGLNSHLSFTGRVMEAKAEMKKLVALAEAEGDVAALDEAHRTIAICEIYTGEIAAARERLERLAAPHKDINDAAFFARFQAERGVAVRCTLSLALFMAGEPRRAIHVASAAVERAKIFRHSVSHLNSLLMFAAPIAFWSGDHFAAEDFLQQAERTGRLQEVGSWRELHHLYRSLLRARHRQAGTTEDLMNRMAEVMKAGHFVRIPIYQAMVAEALCEADALVEAETLASEALNLANRLQLVTWEPEIQRVRAMIRMKQGHSAEGEDLLRQAIQKAASMGALTFELRATLMLAARLKDKGRTAEAQDMLATICSKFLNNEVFTHITNARRMLSALKSRGICSAGSADLPNRISTPCASPDFTKFYLS